MAAPSHQHRRADKEKYIDWGARGLSERGFPSRQLWSCAHEQNGRLCF